MHKLLLVIIKLLLVSKLRKAFANNSSANINFPKTQLSKIIQSEGFLGRFLGPLLKTGLLLMGNVLEPLVKSVLIPSGVAAAASAADSIRKCSELEDSSLLKKGGSETIKSEAKEQKRGFLGMLLGILGASLLGNLLTGKGAIRAGEGRIRVGENF